MANSHYIVPVIMSLASLELQGRKTTKGLGEGDLSCRIRVSLMVLSQGVTWSCLSYKQMTLMMRLEMT